MKIQKRLIMKKSVAAVLMAVFLLSIALPTSAWANEQITTSATVGVQYKTHIQDKGWESVWKTNGELSGTAGESKRLEALNIQLTGSFPTDANIQTYVHVQNRGDMGPFAMGSDAGTHGEGLRMESIRLVLNNMPGYVLKYNVHVQNKGWLRNEYDDSTWFSSGETAGTAGESLRLESIRIKLVQVNTSFAAYQAALAAVSEDEYTTASWEAYQEVVEANKVTELDSTYAIAKATTAIKNAQSKLVKGKNLAAYKAALAAVNQVEYIEETWDAYQLVVDENVVTQANTQIEINEATSNILAAQKKLQKKVNLTAYKEAVESVREADYSADSWAVYQKVQAAYIMTENNSQTEVDAATEKIIEAQKKMTRKFDFTAYKALLNAVKENDYTTISWATYQKIVAANYIDTSHMSEDTTQTKVEKAIKAIETAQKVLIKAGDLTIYEATIEAAPKADYTAASWAPYQKVLEANKMTKNNTQAEIDAAVAKIIAAQKKLLPAGDLSEYEAALAKVTKDLYTSKSWATYLTVVNANVVTAASGQTAIDAATAKILAAQTKLIFKGDLTAYNIALAARTETSYTSASWATYQKVVKANKVTTDNSQAEIDAATNKIIDAQDKLLPTGKLGTYTEAVNACKEPDYTPTSWATYKTVLNANVMTTDNNDDQIKAAVAKIKAAQAKLVLKVTDALFAQYEIAFSEKIEANFTTISWTAYKKVLAVNIMTRDRSKDDVQKAINAIRAAQFNLQEKGSLIEYQKYEDAVKAKNGLEASYTTGSWANYKKVIALHVVSRENTTDEIIGARKAIEDAEAQLLFGSDLTYYNKAINDYALKQAEFTAGSWSTYLGIISANLVTKDDSQAKVNEAMKIIQDAQKNVLKPNTNMTAFKDSIWLYQENIRQKGAIALKAKTGTLAGSWSYYADKVEQYASFDADGNWTPTGTDDTESTLQSTIDAHTEIINIGKDALLPKDDYLDYSAYDLARSELGTAYEIKYTTKAYTDYVNACNKYYIPIKILGIQPDIDYYATQINSFKILLKEKADAASVAAFGKEVGYYNGLKLKEGLYDATAWNKYETYYKQYAITTETALDKDKNSTPEYTTATKQMQDARLALFTKSSGENIYLNTTNIGQIATGTNVVDKAIAYLEAQGFTTEKYTIGFAQTGTTDTATITGEIISGTPGNTLTGIFTIKDKQSGTLIFSSKNVVFTIIQP